jgi:hypothetical protein
MKNLVTFYRESRDELYMVLNLAKSFKGVKLFGLTIIKRIPDQTIKKFENFLKALDLVILGNVDPSIHMADSLSRSPETKTLGDIYVEEV